MVQNGLTNMTVADAGCWLGLFTSSLLLRETTWLPHMISLTAPTGQEWNCQGSLKPTFLVHLVCYNPLVKPGHKASPDSRDRKTDSTSWWEDRQCHAAKPHTYRDVGATVAIFINHLPRSPCFSAHTQVCLVCLSPDSSGPSPSSSYFQFYARVEKGQLSCCKR